MSRNLVLVHGYSDRGESFDSWKAELEKRGRHVSTINICSYRSLTNEVTIKDIAEGFDRALRVRANLCDPNEPFDAIVHSTGMLVIRAWLTAYGRHKQRAARLKHLVALAPATFGSPLAHKGRSWLGALFKGNRDAGPDFLEAGDFVLDGLELGSRFTWDLAHADLFGSETFYGPEGDTPYVFVLCGNQGYRGLRRLVNPPGSDGTVRWAGCGLDARKVTIDLTRENPSGQRFAISAGPNLESPVYLLDGHDHGTIMQSPGEPLVDLVDRALKVEDAAQFAAWHQRAQEVTGAARAGAGQWQQFVVRAIDERGDPIPDYHVELFTAENGRERSVEEFDLDVHTYRADPSLRCFQADVGKLKGLGLKNLWVRVMASSGSELVGYWGVGADRPPGAQPAVADWDARLDISDVLKGDGAAFFRSFTTTLVEIRLNREPLPFDPAARNQICWFLP